MPSSPGAGPIWRAQVGGPGTFTLNLTELGPGTDVADGTGDVILSVKF